MLVKYIEDNTIEGYVKDEKDFNKWLLKHNKERKEIGEIEEEKREFELIFVDRLN